VHSSNKLYDDTVLTMFLSVTFAQFLRSDSVIIDTLIVHFTYLLTLVILKH